MKFAVSIFASILVLMVAFSTQAADKKLGHVIAVEREINNLYQTCLNSVNQDAEKTASFFSCSIRTLKDNELSLTSRGFIRENNEKCQTNADVKNGNILITFGLTKGSSTLNEAKDCLAQALLKNDSLKLSVFTVE